MKPPEVIDTKRLLLRTPNLNDAEAIFHNYAQDEQVTKHTIWKPHLSVEETKSFLSGCVAAWESGDRFPWVITLKENGELIGMIEIRINDFKADVGYVVARPFWGRGIATRPSLKSSVGHFPNQAYTVYGPYVM